MVPDAHRRGKRYANCDPSSDDLDFGFYTNSLFMAGNHTTPFSRLLSLVLGLLRMPSGFRRISTAFSYGVMCHIIFALAVGAMIAAMFGMSESLGRVPEPWFYVTNVVLVLQFR